MRIKAIHAENFLSFGPGSKQLNLEFDDTSTLTFLVGPNGGGKTNVLRLIKLFLDTTSNTKLIDGGANWKYCYSEDDFFKVVIDVVFDTEEERRSIVDFWKLYFVNMLAINYDSFLFDLFGKKPEGNINFERVNILNNWIFKNISPDGFKCFFNGRFQYQYSISDHSKRLLIFSGEIINDSAQYFKLLLNNDWNGWQIYMGESSKSAQQFNIAHIFKSEDGDLGRRLGDFLIGNADFPKDLPPITADLLLEKSSQDYYSYLNAGTTLSNMPDSFFSDHNLALLKRLNLNLGLSPNSRNDIRFSHVLKALIRKGLMYFESKDIEGESSFDTNEPLENELLQPKEMLISSNKLPLYLYKMKNGSQEDRESLESIRETFGILAGITSSPSFDIKFDITTDPLKVVSRTISIVTDQDIPLNFSGSGPAQMLMLSVLLSENKGRVLFIDEPELRIHPALQGKLAEIIKRAMSQCVIITHSPSIIPVASLENVRRIYKDFSNPIAPFSRVSDRLRKDISDQLKIIKRGRRPDEYRFLFSKCTVFVEGFKEELCLPLWFNKWAKEELTKESMQFAVADLGLGVRFLSPEGKNNIAAMLKIGKEFGVNCLALYDSDVFNNKDKKDKSNQDIIDNLEKFDLLKQKDIIKLGDSSAIEQFPSISSNDNIFICGKFLSNEFHSFDTHPLFKYYNISKDASVWDFYNIALKVLDDDVPEEFLPIPKEFVNLFRRIVELCHVIMKVPSKPI